VIAAYSLWCAVAWADPVVIDVRVLGSGDPVAGAWVRLPGDAGGLSRVADDDGRINLDLSAGTWSIELGSPGHAPRVLVVEVPTSGPVVAWLPPAEPPMEVVVESRLASPHVARQVLDRERVEGTPGTHQDPFRLIQALPGVALTPEYSPSGGDLAIRGATPAESSIFLDGMEIPYLYHFQQYSSVIPTRLLDEVAVYPSTFGASYGDATGGVVTVRSRDADDLRGRSRGGVHGGAHVNLVMGGGLLGAPVGDSLNLAGSVRRSYADLFESGSDQYTVWPVFWDYLAKADLQVADGRRLTLTGIGAGDHYGRYAGDTAALDPLEADATPEFTFERAFHGVLLRDERSSTRVRLDTTVGFVTDARRADVSGEAELRQERYLSLRHQGVWLLVDERLDLDVGVDGRLTWLDLEASPTRAWTELGQEAPILAGGVAVDSRLVRQDLALWAEPRVHFGGLSLQPGVRVQGDVAGADGGANASRVDVDPRLTVQLQLDQDTRLRAAAGVYHQRPELDALDPQGGSNDLDSTRALQAAAGVDLALAGRWELGLDGWAKRIDGAIEFEPGTIVEPVDGSAVGIELSSRYRLRDRFFSWFGLTLGRATRDGAPFDYDQPYALNVVASWNFRPGWSIGARYRYAAGLPNTPIIGGIYQADTDSYTAIEGAVNTERMPDYQKVDLQIEREWLFRAWSLSAYAALWWVPESGNALYPVYSYDYSERKLVVGPPFIPLVGAEATF
jgi:TonB-dependent Receptor Plug Domain